MNTHIPIELIILFHNTGHSRTMCTLVARIVRLRPNFTVTFFVVSSFYDRIKAEIARDFLPGEENMMSRVR